MRVQAIDAGFKIIDANGQSLAYVYGHADPRDVELRTRSLLMKLDASRQTSPSCQTYSENGHKGEHVFYRQHEGKKDYRRDARPWETIVRPRSLDMQQASYRGDV
jgi:hypothetical protein